MPLSSRRMAALLLAVVLLLPTLASAWTHEKSGSLVQNYAVNSRACSDGAGGTFVAYGLYSVTTGNYDVYVQRFDAAGAAKWAAPGVLVCAAPDAQYVDAILYDGYGGCVVAWQDFRSGSGQVDYYAQRVTINGDPQWTLNGSPVCTASGSQSALSMKYANSFVWFAWQDPRNSAASGFDIYAQCLGVFGGAPQLALNGAEICTATGDQNYPDLAVDDNGYAHIVWQDSRSGAADIYFQTMNFVGGAFWAVNGAVACNAAGLQMEPRIECSHNGRTYMAWSDLRGADMDIYAQFVSDYTSSPLWAANGVPVCTANGQQTTVRLAVDQAGSLVVVWGDQRRGSQAGDLYAQKLDQLGGAQWSANGVPARVANGTASSVQLSPDGLGGTLLAWNDSRSDGSDVYAQRLSVYGSPLWTANGVPVGAVAGAQSNPSFAVTPGGGMVVAWDDYYTSPWGARIQKVDEWGYSGADPILASVKDVPNDQGGQVKVSWYASPLDTDPAYRNISDYILYRSVPTPLAAQLARSGVATRDGVAWNGKRYLRTTAAAQDYFWEECAHVVPRHLPTYSHVDATEGDSMAGSNRRTAFMVMAVANYGSAWWTSNADSGYSVDNVAPAAPAPLTGQYALSGTALHWNRNTESDLAGYRVYRGSNASFTPSAATLLATVADTGYVASGATPYFYKLTAVDIHGNESPVATLMPSGTLGVEGGATLRAEFSAPAPNPMRGDRGTTLRFSLAQAGRITLAVYDAQGRVVRALVDGAREAGAHAVAFDGRDGDGRLLAPGLYLARISAPGLNVTRRIVVVE